MLIPYNDHGIYVNRKWQNILTEGDGSQKDQKKNKNVIFLDSHQSYLLPDEPDWIGQAKIFILIPLRVSFQTKVIGRQFF